MPDKLEDEQDEDEDEQVPPEKEPEQVDDEMPDQLEMPDDVKMPKEKKEEDRPDGDEMLNEQEDEQEDEQEHTDNEEQEQSEAEEQQDEEDAEQQQDEEVAEQQDEEVAEQQDEEDAEQQQASPSRSLSRSRSRSRSRTQPACWLHITKLPRKTNWAFLRRITIECFDHQPEKEEYVLNLNCEEAVVLMTNYTAAEEMRQYIAEKDIESTIIDFAEGEDLANRWKALRMESRQSRWQDSPKEKANPKEDEEDEAEQEACSDVEVEVDEDEHVRRSHTPPPLQRRLPIRRRKPLQRRRPSSMRRQREKDLDLDTVVNIVARHVARVGQNLEDSVKHFASKHMTRSMAKVFSFLGLGDCRGSKRYKERRNDAKGNFKGNGRNPAADKEVMCRYPCKGFESEEPALPMVHRGLSSGYVAWVVLQSKPFGALPRYSDCFTQDELKKWQSCCIGSAKTTMNMQECIVQVGRVWLSVQQDPARTVVAMAEVELTMPHPPGFRWNLTVEGGAWDVMRTVANSSWQAEAPVVPGSGLFINIEDLHFSHDTQTEKFTHQGKTILATVLEVLSGEVRPEQIPAIAAVWHDGRWYASTGNRRLAAFRLLRIHAPEQFEKVKVTVADMEVNFLVGSQNGRRPKLTTSRNGEDCKGAWMRIAETGQWVGQSSATYAHDLLSVICRGRILR